MTQLLKESELPKDQIFFHGSAKKLMKKFDKPSLSHPFYMTTDLDYALAFATKRHSSTGHEQEGIKIEFQKSGNDTYVYAVSLNQDGKFLDVRDFDTDEFDELMGLFPVELRKLIDIFASKGLSYGVRKDKGFSKYSNMKNDIWYIFDHLRNTVIGLNNANPDNKNFNRNMFLELTHQNPPYYIFESLRKSVEKRLNEEYSKFYKQYSEEERERMGKELYGDERICGFWGGGSIDILEGSKLESFLHELGHRLFNKEQGGRVDELYENLMKAMRLVFLEFVKDKKEKGYSRKYSSGAVISKMSFTIQGAYERDYRQDVFNKIPDEKKHDPKIRVQLLDRYTHTNAALTTNVDFRETEFGSIQNMLEVVTKGIEKDEYLNSLPDDITTHQMMGHYFEILYKKGYCGVITSEDDEDESSGKTVITNCAVGIWDVQGLDKASVIPMKYKWLKKVVQQAKDSNSSPSQKIDEYVKLYKRISGEK